MAEIRFPCPGCGRTMKTNNPALAGKAIKCPGCQTPVTIPTATSPMPRPASARPKAAPPPPKKRPRDDDDLFDAEVMPEAEEMAEVLPDEAEAPRKRGGLITVASVLAAFLLLAYAGLAAVVFYEVVEIPYLEKPLMKGK